MSDLRPFFGFYGAKWRAARAYAPPVHSTIVEPFAGSAGYSLRYPDARVRLFDRDECIAGVWDFLIHATASELLALPDLMPGAHVDTLNVPQEARWLIGFWINTAPSSPRKTLSANARRSAEEWRAMPRSPRPLFWSARVRERLAVQVDRIRHWTVTLGDYSEAPNVSATWFVDPPYAIAGRHYRHRIGDYAALAAWCRSRKGQVIVCEGNGADWLPFSPLGEFKSNACRSGRATSVEVVWESTG